MDAKQSYKIDFNARSLHQDEEVTVRLLSSLPADGHPPDLVCINI